MRIIDSILRAGEGRLRRHLEHLTACVNAVEDDYIAMTDAELASQTALLKERLAAGESLDDLLPEAFATVREASRRVLGMRHFDVQVMGGAALHLGNIAEMRTGEGKTLVSTLPAYLNALSGEGVHVVTVNDYLAARDAAHMGKVHEFLGLTVGVVIAGQSEVERRAAYACDITYGTNNEFGFDYLRDNMATSADKLVQRGHHFAVVDEVDSILIDEARTPLIISGPGENVTAWYHEFARIAGRLTRGIDYDVDEKKNKVGMLEPGVEKVESWLGTTNLYSVEHTPLVGYLNQAVRAKELYQRDKEYIVADAGQGPEVMIVDEHTGRVLAGRRYSEGLHQALEAKEGVAIQQENQTLAAVTLQNYFRLYSKLSGMTGTGSTEAAEFHSIYGLGVIPIPTNREPRRIDTADVIFRTEEMKFAAVVADIAARHQTGQPVLVGTTSVEKSELLSQLLTAAGVKHEVLNAKNHEREAHVISQAGRLGAVTVATNMAGRGTDIILGGNADELARDILETMTAELTSELADRADRAEDQEPLAESAVAESASVILPEEIERLAAAAEKQAKAIVADERTKVAAAGGLYVLGTERHESRRIDNQLRGRAGRQGDPGETRFYLSLEDELVRKFAGPMLTRAMEALGAGGAPIESGPVNKAVAAAQGSMEAQNYEARKDVLKYDDVLSTQREVIYAERRRVLEGGDVTNETHAMIRGLVDRLVVKLEGYAEEWDLDELLADFKTYIPTDLDVDELIVRAGLGNRTDLTPSTVHATLTIAAFEAYAAREAELGAERMRDLERRVLLAVVDKKWREHLYEMDYMRVGIGLRAFAQRDPLVEYQREAHDMFLALLETIKDDTVGYLLNVVVPEPAAPSDAAHHPDHPDNAGSTGTAGNTDEDGPSDSRVVDSSDDAAQ